MHADIAIDGYTIFGKLNRSPRSLIYRAVRQKDDRPVVIKTLNRDHPSARDIARIQYEYDITKELDVPGVIRFYSLEKTGNKPAIVMEDFGGRDLTRLIREGRGLSPDLFLEIAVDIAGILDRVHRRNVIHMGVTPGNILRDPESGKVKLIDFSMAGKLTRERPAFATGGVPEGSLPYISPEQTGRINREVDFRGDFYSLGVTFYELLTGALPFSAVDTMGWLYSHIAKTPPHPGEVNPAIPGAVADIILKLMSKDPEDRYQSALGLFRDLEECRRQWREKQTIDHFTPGRWDVSEQFQVSQKLYFHGRGKDLTALSNAFKKAAGGDCELILISGTAGMGKSEWGHEIRRTVAAGNGYFIAGKCEQFEQDTPFHALTSAFQGLVRQLLCEPEERLAQWKKQLHKALSPNGLLIQDIVPEVELLAGEQPPLQSLNPEESEHRLMFTLCDFIRVFAQPAHPLVIFLDDLQWCDGPTLTLLRRLLESRDTRCLMVVGAYNDDETPEDHPLRAALADIRKHLAPRRITLGPLGPGAVTRVITETLHCDWEHAEPLARILYHKTKGSPYSINLTLQKLYRESLVNFDRQTKRWSWELEKIEAVEVCGNVVEDMILRLKKYPPETRRLLSLASCIGSRFDLNTLAALREDTASAVLRCLKETVRDGLVIPLSENYRLAEAVAEVADEESGSLDPGFNVDFRFQHHRLRQVAYGMLTEKRKEEIHCAVGRMMLRNLSQKEKDEKVIDIANHLNRGFRLIADGAERIELSRLNLAAGRKTKSANAYHAAAQNLKTARALLGENPWETHYNLTYEIYKEYSECRFLCGEFGKAEELSKILLNHAKTKLEKTEIHKMRLIQYTAKGEPELAIEAGLTGLSLLGIKIPANPGKLSIANELIRLKIKLRKRDIAGLADLPLMEHPEQLLASKLLATLCQPAYVSGNKNLYVWTVTKQILLSLQHGNCPESTYGYATYGTLSDIIFNDLKTGFEFGKLAVNLLDRFDDLGLRCQTLLVFTIFIHSWNRHWKTLPGYLKKAVTAGYQSGDLLYMGYASSGISHYDPTLDLTAAIELGARYLPRVSDTKQYNAWAMGMLVQQFHLNLQGLTRERFSLSDNTFDEALCLEKFTQAHSTLGVGFYHLKKSEVALFYENFRSALEHVSQTDKAVKAMLGQPATALACTAAFFTYASLLPQMTFFEKRKAWKRLKKEYKKMKRWADHCPDNFQHHRLLMEAEMARLSGKITTAQARYDTAVAAAQKNGFLRYEAFGNERAAKFYREQGRTKIAALYMKEAHYCYQRWGAVAKVRHMEENYPELLEASGDRKEFTDFYVKQPSLLKTSSTQTAAEGLDLESIADAAQTLSGEMNMEKLLEKLMRITRETAGAEKAVFILQPESALEMSAPPASIGDPNARVMDSGKLGDSEQLPISIIRYVERSSKNVVLGNAADEGDFTRDPYIRKHRPKSILCMPIIRREKQIGVLYLENSMTREAFTEGRLTVLDVLASQAAISFENAALYASQEKKVIERTQELEFRKYALETLDEIVRTINAETEFEALLQAVLRETMVIKGVERALFMVREADTDVFCSRAAAGYNLEQVGKTRITQEQIEARYTKNSRQIHDDIYIAKDIEKRPHGEKVPTAFGVPQSTLFTRIRVEDQTDAYLLFFNMHHDDAFDDQDLFLMKNLKEHIVAAFLKTRALDNLEKNFQRLKETQSQLVQAEKMAGLGTLVAGVAHEINNPTNFVHAGVFNLNRDLGRFKKFLTELAGEDADAEVLAAFDEKFETLFKHLSTMQEGAKRIKDIVKALSSFSRHSEAEMERVHLREGLETTAKLVKANYKDQVEFVYDFRADPAVECFIAELNQVFMNIMVNACQAVVKARRSQTADDKEPPKGTLTIQTAEEGGMAVIRFRDTGAGMSREVQRRMFDPFFTTKPVGEGTGLGLSISFGIIREHKGRIEVDSEPGKGSLITIHLPPGGTGGTAPLY